MVLIRTGSLILGVFIGIALTILTVIALFLANPANMAALDTRPHQAAYPSDPNKDATPEAPAPDPVFEHHEQTND